MSSFQDIWPVTSTDLTTARPVGATFPRAPHAPANDNAGGGVLPDTTRLLAHPDVVRYLRATLRRYRVAPGDMADAIANVQLRSIESARAWHMPADVAQWKALTATVAARWAVDQFRESVVRNKYDKGPSDDADGCVRPTLHPEHRDRFDTKRYFAVLKELFDSGQLPEGAAEILWGEADRVQHAEIAAELGIGEVALRSRLFRMRAKFRAKLAALGMLALALLLLTGLLAPSRKVAGPVSTKGREPTPSARSSWRSDGGTDPSGNSSLPAQRNRVLPD
jgi:DNA-directed RNA polymerase specialized sigma24 family protein